MGLFTYAQMQKSSGERFIVPARLSAILLRVSKAFFKFCRPENNAAQP